MLLPELPTREFAPCIPDGRDSDLSTFLCGSRILAGYSYPDILVPSSVPAYFRMTVENAFALLKLLTLYRPFGDILDHGIADSDRICRMYMRKREIENITLRNSPQSILFCSYSESVTVSDYIGNVHYCKSCSFQSPHQVSNTKESSSDFLLTDQTRLALYCVFSQIICESYRIS